MKMKCLECQMEMSRKLLVGAERSARSRLRVASFKK